MKQIIIKNVVQRLKRIGHRYMSKWTNSKSNWIPMFTDDEPRFWTISNKTSLPLSGRQYYDSIFNDTMDKIDENESVSQLWKNKMDIDNKDRTWEGEMVEHKLLSESQYDGVKMKHFYHDEADTFCKPKS